MSEVMVTDRDESGDPEGSVIAELHEDLARLRRAVAQWNPHHPQQARRLRGFGAVIDAQAASLEAAAVLREQGVGLHVDHLPQLRRRLDLSLRAAGVRPGPGAEPTRGA